MADGIHLERLGIPTVSIVTDAFPQSSDAMARLEGAPGYRYVAIPHPLSSLSEEECAARAADLLPEVLEVLGLPVEAPAGDGNGAGLTTAAPAGTAGAPTGPTPAATSAPGLEPTRVAVDELVRVIEHYYERGWTDGLPVVPVTGATVEAFLAEAGLEPEEGLLRVDHLDKTCTAHLAAVAAAMAGCEPGHFPVVVAALRALQPLAQTGLLQSTTGQAVCLVVNGPIRSRLGFNGAGNVFGPGYRANATVGRAIRLMVLNALGVRPGGFDQSTQGTPGKYCLCLAENEEASPWAPLHVERGFGAEEDVVTVHLARSTVHVEQRTSSQPEQVLATIADSMSYAGGFGCRGATVVMGPEHAQLLGRAGWTRQGVKEFLFERWGRTRGDLRRLGLAEGDGLSGAISGAAETGGDAGELVHFGDNPDSILLVVAGAGNAGVSTVIPAHRPMRQEVAFHSARIG